MNEEAIDLGEIGEEEVAGQVGRLQLITYLYELVKNWPNTFVRVRQDGKWRSLPLTQVRDQKVVLRFLMERLQEYKIEQGLGRVK